MKKIEVISLLIANNIKMLTKYKAYGAELALEELKDLQATICDCHCIEEYNDEIETNED